MANFSTKINEFIELLASVKLVGSSFNQYSYHHPANEVRRKNLALYLHEVQRLKSQHILLSEAPGYQGARLTGVPLTSEFILLNGIGSLGVLGKEKGYQKTDEFEKIRKEPSATIVWNTLTEIKQIPLLWGSFPFHPHRPNEPWSNRRPTTEEVKIGQRFFKILLNIFKIREIVAVGNVAHENLTKLGFKNTHIRHPSHGGAKLFSQGLKKCYKRNLKKSRVRRAKSGIKT